MPLSPEDLEQIRGIVKSELQLQGRPFWNSAKGCLFGVIVCFLAFLAVHVIVIGCFIIYHLRHHG